LLVAGKIQIKLIGKDLEKIKFFRGYNVEYRGS